MDLHDEAVRMLQPDVKVMLVVPAELCLVPRVDVPASEQGVHHRTDLGTCHQEIEVAELTLDRLGIQGGAERAALEHDGVDPDPAEDSEDSIALDYPERSAPPEASQETRQFGGDLAGHRPLEEPAVELGESEAEDGVLLSGRDEPRPKRRIPQLRHRDPDTLGRVTGSAELEQEINFGAVHSPPSEAGMDRLASSNTRDRFRLTHSEHV
jgi:hypothetical protein